MLYNRAGSGYKKIIIFFLKMTLKLQYFSKRSSWTTKGGISIIKARDRMEGSM